MILNKITLHNFMSYADAQLDLTSVNIACLSGANGAGKSALLDAVTWALWDEARGSGDELIRLGQSEMWVEVIFTMDNQRFRVKRWRAKPARSASSSSRGSLDLMQWADNGVWTSLTSPTMRETQKRINELMKMEYETFVNSVYLRQGHADEFTTKPPSRRKQVLSDILGLNFFDRLQNLAKAQCKLLTERKLSLGQSLSGLDEVKEELETIEDELSQASSDLDRAAKELLDQSSLLNDLHSLKQELNLAEEKLNTGSKQLKELEIDIETLNMERLDNTASLTQLDDLLSQEAEIEQAQKEFIQLKAQIEALDEASHEAKMLEKERVELRSDIARQSARLELELESLKEELSGRQARYDELVRKTLKADRLKQDHKRYQKLVAKESKLAARQEAFIQLMDRQADLKSKISASKIRLEVDIEQKMAMVAELDEIVATESSLEKEQMQLAEKREELDRLETEFEEIEQSGLNIKSEIASLDHKIDELDQNKKQNLEKISELKAHSSSSICPLCSHPIVDRESVIHRYENENESYARLILHIEEKKGKLEEQRAKLRKRYAELKLRLGERQELDNRIGRYNEKSHAVKRAGQSRVQIAEELDQLKAKLESKDFAHLERESLVSIRAELNNLDFDPVLYSNLQAEIRTLRHVEIRYKELKQNLSEKEELLSRLPACQGKIDLLAQKLSGKDYAIELQARLAGLEEKLGALHFDPDEHLNAKKKLSELLPRSARFRELKSAQDSKPRLVERIRAIETRLDKKQSQLGELMTSIATWQESLTERPELVRKIADTQACVEELKLRKEELGIVVARLESRMEQLVLSRQELDSNAKEMDRIREELKDYASLQEIFGKKGIQAIIIESAIPEIESEANRILSRLSDNKMHIALKTQSKTKKGKPVETLELLIADEMGTRNYELYSGGEAFKVDFALRVALCRLVARRAGARLETLVIDEGFGSQDSDSRERLLNVISSVKEDFGRILVITHIDDIKEMFPVKIQVAKDEGMSTLSLVS